MEKTITISQKEYEELLKTAVLLKKTQEENDVLKTKVDYLTQLLKLRAIDKFAQKSETHEQLSLFDDIELNKEIEELEQKVEEKKAKKLLVMLEPKRRI